MPNPSVPPRLLRGTAGPEALGAGVRRSRSPSMPRGRASRSDGCSSTLCSEHSGPRLPGPRAPDGRSQHFRQLLVAMHDGAATSEDRLAVSYLIESTLSCHTISLPGITADERKHACGGEACEAGRRGQRTGSPRGGALESEGLEHGGPGDAAE